MKEHRTKALRVTTPHSIENSGANNKDDYCGRENGNDLFGTLQILQFELVPSRSNSPPSPSPSASSTQLNVSSSSDTFYMQSSSSRRSQSEMMTTHTATATFTASPAYGKQDSFYRWFSSEFQKNSDNNDNDDEEEEEEEDDDDDDTDDNTDDNDDDNDSERICHYARKPRDLFCGKCEKNLQQTWKTCHCRTTFDEKKVKQNRSVLSMCSIRHHSASFSFFHSGHCCSILDLVSGNLSDNWFLKIRDIKEAISRAKNKNCYPKNQWYKVRDANGNTALLVSGQKLLREGCFDGAVELAKILLEEGSDVNVINNENRTLLTYSIQYMDKSIRLTTLLINYGANVWPMPAKVELPVSSSSSSNSSSNSSSSSSSSSSISSSSSSSSSSSEKYGNGSNCNNSAFTWFLRSIIRQLKLSEHCLQTLYLLAEVMGEKPDLMHSHVMSTMFSHAKCYTILGPVFLQIKLAMSPYWAQPQSLKFQCKSVIRKSIISVPGRFINAENMSSLMLPPSLQSYLMLEY